MGINVSDLLVMKNPNHEMLIIYDEEMSNPINLKWVQDSISVMFGDLLIEQTKDFILLDNGSKASFMNYRNMFYGYHPNTAIICNNYLMNEVSLTFNIADLIKNSGSVKYWNWIGIDKYGKSKR